MTRRIWIGIVVVIAGCGRGATSRQSLAGDGKRHYSAYAAGGEVTDARGAINIYAATGAGALAPAARNAAPLVYVPNSRSGSISVIDPATYRVIRTVKTGVV